MKTLNIKILLLNVYKIEVISCYFLCYSNNKKVVAYEPFT